MIQMAEDHQIHLVQTFLYLVLGTAVVVEHIEKKSRNRQYQYNDDPDELEHTVMVS